MCDITQTFCNTEKPEMETSSKPGEDVESGSEEEFKDTEESIQITSDQDINDEEAIQVTSDQDINDEDLTNKGDKSGQTKNTNEQY